MLFGQLGKKPRRVDSRTLAFERYIQRLEVIFPNAHDYSLKVPVWPVMLNDSLGDCTCACAGHMIEGWTADAGSLVVPPDNQILSAYEAVGGYVPGDDSTDNGAVILDVLNYWRKTGIAGRKILAYASIDFTKSAHIEEAVWLFGSVYIGVQLPLYVQGADVWSVPTYGPNPGPAGDGTPGSWGGHAIPIIEYGDHGVSVISWGKKIPVSWDFLWTYCDEAYAVLSQDWIEKNQRAPNNFNLSALEQDLKQITA